MRRLLQAVTIAALALTLSGCMKLNMDLTVNPGDTVSGKVVLGIAKELAGLAGTSETQTADLFTATPGMTVTPYDDGKYVGSTYSFTKVPLSKFAPNTTGDSIALRRDGDDIVVSGAFDPTTGSSTSQDEASKAMAALLLGTMDLRISITLPGTITSSNGSVVGNTVTWKLSPTEKTELQARAHAPLASGGNTGLILAIGVLLLVGIITALLWNRRRRAPLATAAPDAPPAPDAAASPDAPATPPSDLTS